MKRDEIKAELAKCKNVVELIRTANTMKQNGEKESTVNKLVTQYRKELLSRTSSIKRLERVTFNPQVPTQKISTINFQVQFLNKPVIVYDQGTGTIII